MKNNSGARIQDYELRSQGFLGTYTHSKCICLPPFSNSKHAEENKEINNNMFHDQTFGVHERSVLDTYIFLLFFGIYIQL